jgi:hypothetical protein
MGAIGRRTVVPALAYGASLLGNGGLGRLGSGAMKVGGKLLGPAALAMTGYEGYQRMFGDSDAMTSMSNDRVSDSTTFGISDKGIYNTASGLSGGLAMLGPAGIAASLAAMAIDSGTQQALAGTTASTGAFFSKGGLIERFASGKDVAKQGLLGRGMEALSTIGMDDYQGSTAMNLDALISAMKAGERQVGEGYKLKYTDSARQLEELRLLEQSGALGTDELNQRVQQITSAVANSDAADEQWDVEQAQREKLDAGDDPQKKIAYYARMQYQLLARHFGGAAAGAA